MVVVERGRGPRHLVHQVDEAEKPADLEVSGPPGRRLSFGLHIVDVLEDHLLLLLNRLRGKRVQPLGLGKLAFGHLAREVAPLALAGGGAHPVQLGRAHRKRLLLSASTVVLGSAAGNSTLATRLDLSPVCSPGHVQGHKQFWPAG